MLKRHLVAIVAAIAVCLAMPASALARTDHRTDSAATPMAAESSEGSELEVTSAQSGYAPVNGLSMYYEIHGTGPPLVLLHGALSTIDVDFGKVLPYLARTRQVIAIEQQAHGRTADIERPLTFEQMAEDTVALLRQLNIQRADFFGYSMGARIALEIAVRHPDLVRRLVLATPIYSRDGFHPGILEGTENLQPDALAGSPFAEAYARVAPNPDDWPTLIAKNGQLHRGLIGLPPEVIQAIAASALLIIGDSDVVRPEHAVDLFRLLGGGVAGDIAGLPRSQLAVLPGTTHITLVHRAEWLASMITPFLDAPLPEGG